MSNVYTTVVSVRNELPADPGTTVLPDSVVETYIEDRSRYIDDSLPNYPTFPDVATAPATPRTIERIARFLAAYDCYVRLGILREDEGVRQVLESQAENQLGLLRRGEIVIDATEFSYEGTASREKMKSVNDGYCYPLYAADLKRED
jgi:hypothetical protein